MKRIALRTPTLDSLEGVLSWFLHLDLFHLGLGVSFNLGPGVFQLLPERSLWYLLAFVDDHRGDLLEA